MLTVNSPEGGILAAAMRNRHFLQLACSALLVLGLCRCGPRVDFGHWQMAANNSGKLPWISFYWQGDSVGKRWQSEYAMMVPAGIEGVSQRFCFQFDIGADISRFSYNAIRPYVQSYPAFAKHYSGARSVGDSIFYFKDLSITLDSVGFSSPAIYIMKDYGDEPVAGIAKASDTVRVGSIGADICKGKVLIIDYPGKRLCIVDSVPKAYQARFADISLDGSGRPVLSMEYGAKTYKVLFDCGSSMFPLLTKQRIVPAFSTAPVNDTVQVSAWGKMVEMLGRPMKDSFTLADHNFGNIEVYTSREYTQENIPPACDAITGNSLFLDKVIVIDFKNMKFGIL